MTDWPVRTLGDICRIEMGRTPSRGDSKGWDKAFKTTNHWASIADLTACNGRVLTSTKERISDYAAKTTKVVPAGTLMMSFKLSIGKLAFAGCDLYTNEAIAAFHLHEESGVDSDFLYWALSVVDWSALTKGSEKVKGATMNKAKLNLLEIPVPPLKEQKRVVKLLDAATSRVTELTACYEQARTHANNLFTSALREALEGNPDWPIKTLGEICEVFDDGDWIESKDQASSGVRLIQTGNVGDGEFKDRSEKARFISESTFSRLRCTEIFPGDLLVSRLPDPVGRACLIPDTGSKMITAVDCTIMRPRKDMMLPQFLVSSTRTSAYREQVRAKITGTTRDRISRSNLAEVQVSVPPLEEQKRIVSRLDEMKAKTSEMVAAYDAKLTAAMNLRQSILESAFAGDL